MEVNGEALQLHAVYKKPYFSLQVMRESVSVLQVTQESVWGTTSHTRICMRHYKSRENLCEVHVLRLNMQWNRWFVWQNCYHHSTKLYWKKIPLICCRWHCYSCCALVILIWYMEWYTPDIQTKTLCGAHSGLSQLVLVSLFSPLIYFHVSLSWQRNKKQGRSWNKVTGRG